MTDPDTPITSPGGDVSPSGPTPSGPTPSGPTPSGPTPSGPTPSGPTAGNWTALDHFDAHGASVFASLCRVTVGDRAVTIDIVRSTFIELDDQLCQASPGFRPIDIDRRSLLIAAHRIYIADPRSDDDWVEPLDASAHDEQAWATARWDRAMAILRGLQAHERVAINMRRLEGISTAAVANVLRCRPDDVEHLVDTAEQSLRGQVGSETPITILRSAELWFGDDERDDIRVALGAVSARPSPEMPPPARPNRRSRPVGWAAIAGVALVALLAVVGVRWVQGLPDNSAAEPVETVVGPTPDTVTTQFPLASASRLNGVTTEIDVTAIDGAIGEPDVFFMASGLTDPEVVAPDNIVRYADGKIGLSWHSPCNRPAIAVALTSTATGAVVELTTGSFTVRSCLGMPDRWSAVVRPSRPLPEGGILPLGPRGTVVESWDGLIDADGPGGAAIELANDAFYGSALVDAANQPWVYGLGCSSRSARYLSPIGAIFEIRRAESLDPQSYSASDTIVCSDLASRAVLTGPLGVTFPNAPAEPNAEPRDCAGPAGSLIDVPSARPFTNRFYDGDWSTWDGCLVRRDVIFSEALFETCAGHDVRTITFAAELGEPMHDDSPVIQYIRDPEGVVTAAQDPFRSYAVPSNDVHDTGLRFGDQQLWVSNETEQAIYVRVGRRIERWPRFDGAVTCTNDPAVAG